MNFCYFQLKCRCVPDLTWFPNAPIQQNLHYRTDLIDLVFPLESPFNAFKPQDKLFNFPSLRFILCSYKTLGALQPVLK